MFGRIRASPSSLDSLEGFPPSKILKDDSFSIYEATLMKLKLGAKRDKLQTNEKEFINDLPVTDEANMDVDCTPATAVAIGIAAASSSVGDNDDTATLMDTDCSCVATVTLPAVITSVSDSVCTENYTEQPRQNNVSILHFYSLLPEKNDSCRSASSTGSVVSNGGTRSGVCE